MDARLASLSVAAFLFGIGSLSVPASPVGRAVPGSAPSQPDRWGFDVDLRGSLPPGSAAFSGVWGVRPVPDAPSGRNALCQLAKIPSSALSLGDDLFGDVIVTTRFKLAAGQADQAAGLLFRIQDPDNYYVLRANALASSVSVDKYASGRLSTLKESMAHVPTGHWQELRVEAAGDRLRGFLNSQPVIEVVDDAYRAGQIGLWSRADSVTCFDDVTARRS